MFVGSHVTELVYAEIIPLETTEATQASLSSPFVKQCLQELGIVRISQWHGSRGDLEENDIRWGQLADEIEFPSLDPNQIASLKCKVVGFGFPFSKKSLYAIVTASTLVHCVQRQQQSNVCSLKNKDSEEVLANHQPKTIQSLRIRMRQLLSRNIRIGTTPGAHRFFQKQQKRSVSLSRCLGGPSTNSKTKPQAKTASSLSSTTTHQHDQGAVSSLMVYSPRHRAGKTLLVQILAEEMQCRVHKITYSSLMANYGAKADAGLESELHALVMAAAVRKKNICILLDRIDSFAGTPTKHDAHRPIVHAIQSILKNLTTSLGSQSEFPFPLSNPMYNVGATNNHGRVLSVRLALVGISSCSDEKMISELQDNVFDPNHTTRFRLPDDPFTDPTCRCRAFQLACRRENVHLSEEAIQLWKTVSASLVATRRFHGRSSINQNIARQLSKRMKMMIQTGDNNSNEENQISGAHLLATLQYMMGDKNITSVVNASQSKSDGTNDNQDIFASVGGNDEAKSNILEALSLDPGKRKLLCQLGMSPPSGILLYGPPGTGKTLIAKAVAALLQRQSKTKATTLNNEGSGGFFSLRASDVVMAQVGTSEKIIAETFSVAMKNTPAVIFIDEFEALFADRQATSGSSSKLTSTLLQCMDDVKQWDFPQLSSSSAPAGGEANQRIIVLGATNAPWMVDKAFLRQGRFDRIIHIGLPNEEERRAILQLHLGRMRLDDFNQIAALAHELGKETKGFSGADIAALCRAATIRCLTQEGGQGKVKRHYFIEALEHDVEATSNEYLVEKLANQCF